MSEASTLRKFNRVPLLMILLSKSMKNKTNGRKGESKNKKYSVVVLGLDICDC
jgi:hypothetical protein